MANDWQPPTQAEAKHRADFSFLAAERDGNWNSWRGAGAPPWWVAAAEWVWTNVEAYGSRLLSGGCFDDSVRHRLVAETITQAESIHERKLRPYDTIGLPPSQVGLHNFKAFVLQQLMSRFALFDLEVLICTDASAVDTPNQIRAQVDAFIGRVLEATGRRVTRTDIWHVAGYKDATQFQRFQRNERTTPGSVLKFMHILRLPPQEFVARMNRSQKSR